MKHRVVGRRLDRTTEHRTAMFKNMVTSLFRHERIVTTTPKAKELKRFADKVITQAKRGTPHARRLAHRNVRDVEVLNKLFDTLAERFKARPGGYTRIVRVGRRAGDNAEMSVIELVDRAPAAAPEAEEKGEKKAAGKAEKAPKAAKAPKAEKKPAKKAAKAE
ncbi:50S ribosomal protein L17 [Anaeromyxobacter dehalogenans]|uniref:Large ribosomal subunit protein bL17 n=1 Tax=Anaeromyxobacter dehalogenans (strain 2CP-C) TaxID=290397 RepID=RL17_ANADE|nr:50S ribosomal protein L17 [Anaeromyxobacter dehalogenans]Q2IJ58.1 RecName: Full=Large ribosomal subunit protein bL17; AltName: Full=50S ribosomal protein L17 [Anaeromyxobacter dehalogenans 2CP-C]ABC81689.1 LSU ribosomal protein L17P [Anaeromyxobacter dehalogenans 2CP-C]